MLDWNDLRYVWVIARSGSLAAAARELGVEHSTVGRRLSAIEAALGTKLFTRGPAGLSATPACRDAMTSLDAIGKLVEELERRLPGGDDRLDGSVRLTAPEMLSPYIARLVGELRARQPSIAVELLAIDRRLDLTGGEAEVAIRAAFVGENDVIAKKLVDARFALWTSESYLARKGAPAAPDDLGGHDVIAYGPGISDFEGARWLDAHLAGANVVVRAHSMHGVYNAVIEGLGISVLPCLPFDARLRRLPSPPIGSGPLFVAYHPDLARVARVRAVVDFLVGAFERDRAIFEGA